MLPSRSQLQAWNTDSLTPAGKAVEAAGESVYRAVRHLEDEINRMPETGAWAGKSHGAATKMFSRATESASQFTSYAEGVGSAFKTGDNSIGAARHRLLQAADDIDNGDLQVSDAWVVLIKPAQMSAEKVAELERQAAEKQAEINELLLAVGDADDETADAIQAAAGRYGFELPDQSLSWLNVGDLPPGDQVPNPRQPDGMAAQQMLRDADKAVTVRDAVQTFDRDGNRITKLTMQDGSRQEITTYNPYPPGKNPVPGDLVEVTHYDRNGNFISLTQSQHHVDGSQSTNIMWGNGTQLIMTQRADGTQVGEVTTADGRHGALPDEFFTHPVLTTVGGGLTALEKQSKIGIPGLTPSSVEGIGKTAKFAGPTLGVATALYDTVTAGTLQNACVAAVSGASGVAGAEVSAPVLAAAFAGVLGPEAAPFGVGLGNVLGGWTFGYLGGIVGNVVCRP